MRDAAHCDFRARILARLAELESDGAQGAEARQVVSLDQQAVGRLSRMDALQNQAMAKAQEARRKSEAAGLHAALYRLETGDYGLCEDCGEDIPKERLLLDLAATRCVPCVSG